MYCTEASTAGTSAAARKCTGTSRFPTSVARRSSSAHSGEATESGLMTNTKLFAASMPVPSSRRQGAPGGMSSLSIQMLRPRASSASLSRNTNAWSRRE